MSRQKKKKGSWGRAALYGGATYVTLPFGVAGSVMGADVYKAKKEFKKFKNQPPDFAEYWQRNPDAARYYEHQQKAGNTEKIRKLKERIKKQFKEKPPKTNIGGIHFTEKGKFKRFDVSYVHKATKRFSHPGYRIGIAGATAAAALYGYHSAKKRKKRK